MNNNVPAILWLWCDPKQSHSHSPQMITFYAIFTSIWSTAFLSHLIQLRRHNLFVNL